MKGILKFIFDALKGNRDRNTRIEEARTISELFDNILGGTTFNLIPSDEKANCCELAIFISISKSPKQLKLRQDQFIPLDKLLPKVVQQVQGSCAGKNKEVYILCDEISTISFEPWLDNLRAIRKQSKDFGIYYFGGSSLKDITDVVL